MDSYYLENEELSWDEHDSAERILAANLPVARVKIERQLVQGDYWFGPRQATEPKWLPLESDLMQALEDVVDEGIGVLSGDYITISIQRDEVRDTEFAARSFPSSPWGSEDVDEEGRCAHHDDLPGDVFLNISAVERAHRGH